MTAIWRRKCESFEEDRRADREFWSAMSPEARVAGRFGSQPVSYLGRSEFFQNKRAAGRPQDLAEIDALE